MGGAAARPSGSALGCETGLPERLGKRWGDEHEFGEWGGGVGEWALGVVGVGSGGMRAGRGCGEMDGIRLRIAHASWPWTCCSLSFRHIGFASLQIIPFSRTHKRTCALTQISHASPRSSRAEKYLSEIACVCACVCVSGVDPFVRLVSSAILFYVLNDPQDVPPILLLPHTQAIIHLLPHALSRFTKL